MKKSNQLFSWIAIMMVIFSAFSCNKANTVETQVDINIQPQNPIVFKADFSLVYEDITGFQTFTVTGPWALVNMEVHNGSQYPITIMEVDFSGTTLNKLGSTEQISSTFSISNVFPPVIQTVGSNTPPQTTLLVVSPSKKGTLQYYMSGLPSDTVDYSFNLTGEMIGFVGSGADATVPTARFDKFFYFSTQ